MDPFEWKAAELHEWGRWNTAVETACRTSGCSVGPACISSAPDHPMITPEQQCGMQLCCVHTAFRQKGDLEP